MGPRGFEIYSIEGSVLPVAPLNPSVPPGSAESFYRKGLLHRCPSERTGENRMLARFLNDFTPGIGIYKLNDGRRVVGWINSTWFCFQRSLFDGLSLRLSMEL